MTWAFFPLSHSYQIKNWKDCTKISRSELLFLKLSLFFLSFFFFSFLNCSSDQISVVPTRSGFCVCVCKSLPSKLRWKQMIAQHFNSLLVCACALSFGPSVLFQVVLSCTLARLEVPVRVLAARQVDTRPSRPPPTRSLHPRRVSPFRRSEPWSKEGSQGEEHLPRKWSFSFPKLTVLQLRKLRRCHHRPTTIPPLPKGLVASLARSPVSTYSPPSSLFSSFLGHQQFFIVFLHLTTVVTSSFTETGGMVLLCKVCGDIASGFHYGVHACEGCKVRPKKGYIMPRLSYYCVQKTQWDKRHPSQPLFFLPSFHRVSSGAAFSRISTTRCVWRMKTVSSCAWTVTGASTVASRSVSPWACPEMVRDHVIAWRYLDISKFWWIYSHQYFTLA